MISTTTLELDPQRPSPRAIERATRIIRDGGLVAFPTETVYGLGADATNEAAIKSIFIAKGRPSDNPLIVHVSDLEMLHRVADEVTDKASRLIERFWPGPLTLVLKRSTSISAAVSAGLSTVAVRMPRGRIALELIRKAATPLAAPSANLSGHPSPTRAEHVAADLSGRIQMILDGGETNIGIESTVIDVTTDPPAILRPGWITREAISRIIGPVDATASAESLARSPGTRHRHYTPRARVVLVESGQGKSVEQVCRDLLASGAVGFFGHTSVSISNPDFKSVIVDSSAEAYAHSLYAALRELDQSSPAAIVVEGIEATGEGGAVMDRLRRAASEIVS